MGLFRRLTPAVFVGTAAVLVASQAGAQTTLATPEVDPALGTPSTGVADNNSPLSGLWPGGDDDYDDEDHDDDDDDGYRAAAPSPRQVTPPVTSVPNSAQPQTNSAGCTAAEITGRTVRTEWGPVQVAARVNNGRVCEVRVLTYPDGDRKSVSINARALPALERQVLTAGNAQIDGISGATVTSDGYRASLQSVLDQAR